MARFLPAVARLCASRAHQERLVRRWVPPRAPSAAPAPSPLPRAQHQFTPVCRVLLASSFRRQGTTTRRTVLHAAGENIHPLTACPSVVTATQENIWCRRAVTL